MSMLPQPTPIPGRPAGEPSPRKGTTEAELREAGERRRRSEGPRRAPWWRRLIRTERTP